jgi:N-acetylglucosaminyldiphosphoundecaprenol N-acetyl-beta-D-mannosaminyltransferase
MTHSEALRQEKFLGVRLDLVTRDFVIKAATQAMRNRNRLQLSDVNVAKLVDMQENKELRRFVEESDIVCPDGMGIVWGGRLLGLPIVQRVTGIDLMVDLLGVCEREGFRPYFFGATTEVIEDMVRKFKVEYPALQVAGWRSGYFSRDDERRIVADIKASKADCVFVGITTPIKERFLNAYRDEMGVPLQVGVGGTFDVLSGHVRRAPISVQKLGFEWLYRLLQEPRRLAGRYFVANSRFVLLLAKDLFTAGRRGAKSER